ncbi:MAG TPA: UPF0182 family protein [Vicinamibacterales bacterium]|nr:UPF0182 family protein [Vicinamibacterales bacterium]
MRFRWILLLLVVAVLALSGTLSYYVDALWFDSLGYSEVFWRSLRLQGTAFTTFFAATFLLLYGAFIGLKPRRLGDFASDNIIVIGGHPVRLPVGRVLRTIVVWGAFAIAVVTGAGMASNWTTFALWWHAGGVTGGPVDPIFGRPLAFYFFTLPAWQAIVEWLLTIGIIAMAMSLFFLAVGGGLRAIAGRSVVRSAQPGLRGVAFAWAFLLLILAAQTWLGRYDRLFAEHTIFSGATYTDVHVTITFAAIASIAFAAGAVVAIAAGLTAPRVRWLVAAAAPAAITYLVGGLVAGYVDGFIVKPNELVREQPYIAHNIDFTRQAYGLNRVTGHPFPAETTIEAADAPNNQATLQNIRLWDWRVLQDTLRQLQEIRTYYDFPDIDIDRYQIDGGLRQVMLATRELNVERLPVSSRNWINEKLIYTHGYGVTMNPVNGFTAEGLPTFFLKDMPVQPAIPSVTVTRPEVYFGEMTDTDVYVKTRQQEFNYPQGESNSLTSYQGTGGIQLGGFFRRLLIAFDRGDIGKLPFSDDIRPESRLLMRRNVRDRVSTLAPFLTFDRDPYIVIRSDGRLAWIMDGFTSSDRYPYSRAYTLRGGARVNYVRNSVKAVIDAYDGATTFYVFDTSDPIIQAYRGIFPVLFRDASAMPADLRAHVRYPEMLLTAQADVYGLYYMTDPAVFHNREDLWTVASEVATGAQGEKAAAPMEPNFILMKLPDEPRVEFVEILPFTPANRNNLIGWIAARSDGEHYGDAIVYDFPKTRLVDGPLQVEARIDQNAQLSGQLSLWNQQGSHVRRGSLLVIPIGKALLYAEAIYLQAERSPMPELRLVVLAMQDRLGYGPTFDAALAALFGAPAAAAPTTTQQPPPSGTAAAPTPRDVNALIAQAAQDLADYQRLTAEGKLAEAGQKLEHLKQTLEQLKKR